MPGRCAKGSKDFQMKGAAMVNVDSFCCLVFVTDCVFLNEMFCLVVKVL